jgi:4a-hydroxytetrahydrobiopterin dehydratase
VNLPARGPRVIDRATCEARLRAMLKSGFGPGLPRREADRFILLHALAQLFDPTEVLAEQPLTDRLAGWLETTGAKLTTDRVTLRRALIDHGFLERDGRGLTYRRSRAHEMVVTFSDEGATATPAAPPAAAAALGADEARARLATLPDWTIESVAGVPRLSRVYTFPDFAGALAFAVRVGAAAEAADHHPEIKVEWGKVTVTWWTHSLGGLGPNDFAMAARSDAVLAPGAPRPA